MSQPDRFVVDVTEQTFEAVVLGASSETAVVVDFWAPWCAPCRTLGPMLERIVAEYGGSVLLAKVNVDEQAALAAQFRVQGIPRVLIFRGGTLVGEFTGAVDEPEVRSQIAAVAPTETDAWVAQAEELLANERLDEAKAVFDKVLDAEPKRYLAMLRLAQIAMATGENDAARDLLTAVPEGSEQHADAVALLGRLDLLSESEAAGGLAAARARVRADENDLDARYALASCLAVEAKYEEALEHLLKVIAADRTFKDGAAKEAMVQIFNQVGASCELANTYRGRLASLLY